MFRRRPHGGNLDTIPGYPAVRYYKRCDNSVNDKRVGQTVGLQNNGRAVAQHVLGQLHLFPEAGVSFQPLEVVSRVRRLGIDTCKQNTDGQTVMRCLRYSFTVVRDIRTPNISYVETDGAGVYFPFFFLDNITRVSRRILFDFYN